MSDRVELQRELDAARADVFALVSTADGLRAWLDEADIDARVGGPLRVRLRDAEAEGKVVAFDPPQHISWTWRWVDEPAATASIVAFDAIDHGARTHLTLRHVGLRDRQQIELHEAMWRYWLERLITVVRSLPPKVESTHP